ncbi:LysR family transcriptional regulator [Zobellella endophytica]|uniref:LysR family transcriptional regulator n=1 Tax=Zobellella endophytica TaxID=2116700 RepID=A0A2P7RB02_9GAMM|nr:LysR family transcriptional regulator [Zobellella endophytica]PSJ47407.1 LysR family transcriptional regulator [Zobellella endophytica]
MDKLSVLTTFVTAAELGSFSRAAERLGKTPSAVTKAVAQLEAELGTRLFERTTRQMALTEAGHTYLEGTRQALMQLQIAGEEVEQLQQELRGRLRIISPPSFAPAFLREVCCRFMTEHPLVRLEVDLKEGSQDLIEGGYDLAVRDGPTDLPGLIAQPLLENRVVLCASPAYLARKGMEVTLDNIEQHDWLILRNPLLSRHYWWVELEGRNTRLRQPVPRLTSDDYDFLLACLLDGQGLQFVPTWSVAPYLARGELVEVRVNQWRVLSAFGPWIHAIFPPHCRNNRKVKAFIELLKAHVQESGRCAR